VETKSPQQSKTLWINIAIMVVAMLTSAMETPLVAENPELMGYFVMAVGAINIVLRFMTNSPLSLRK
jgi:uncharacterized membrane protein